jgi:FAD/FMN-containing dehydrogenase
MGFASKYGIRVTVKTTGHDYDGRSNGDGSLNINLSAMDWTTMVGDGSDQIRVGPGCAWNDVYLEGAKWGLAPVSG